MRKLIRAIGLWLAHRFGMRITDFETGQTLSRAFIIPWRGKIHVIGLNSAARPVFLPQKRITYWKQEIGFSAYPPVDFPRERSTPSTEATKGGDA